MQSNTLLKQVPSQTWLNAQIAEKEHAESLWLPFGNESRHKCIIGEKIKNTFLLDNLEIFLGSTIESLLQEKDVLDVACGPVSFISQIKGANSLEGVDPLPYPEFVYEQYLMRNFYVNKCRLEDMSLSKSYDIIICYNTFQHFENLYDAATVIKKLLRPHGRVYIIDYLEIPTDPAHIQFLTKDKLDSIFQQVSLFGETKKIDIHLPGYVEIGGGHPINVYLANLSH